MVKKKSGNPINGTLVAAFLILIAAFLSSAVQPTQEVNQIISGQVITGFATQETSFGNITSCTVDRYAQGANTKCTPKAGSSGSSLIGKYEDWNGFGQWYNAYSIYVSNNVKASLIECQYSPCNLAACPTGTTLQATFFEAPQAASDGTPYEQSKFGICADTNITVKACQQNVKGRTCKTTSPGTDFVKFTSYITDIINYPGGTRIFRYYDIYMKVPPSAPSHCSDNLWSGDESDQDCGGSCNKCSDTLSCWDNSDCSSNTCYFDSTTLAKRSADGIQPGQRLSPTTSNIQYQGVCQSAAGACTGIDCSQISCQTESACNSNTNCGWDRYAQGANTKCKPLQAICNSFGVKLCNYQDFLAGDFSCLRKNQQGYYTEACIGSGNVGFWNTIEVY